MRDSAEMPARDPPPRLTLPDTAAQDARRRFSRAGAILGRRPALAREAGRSADPEPACLGAFTGVLMPSIPPVQTHYRGVTYRSRTEARWARFFDALSVTATYEPESFSIDGAWYLPDFFVLSWNLYVEVKPDGAPTPFERERCARLSGMIERPVLLVCGAPVERKGILFKLGVEICREAFFVQCWRCGMLTIASPQWEGPGTVLSAPASEERCGAAPPLPGGRFLEAAIEASANERFGIYRLSSAAQA